MELNITLKISEDHLKAAIRADAESLSQTNELSNLVFAKIEENLDLDQITNTYASMLGEDVLRVLFTRWSTTSNGRQVLMDLASKAVHARLDEVIPESAETIRSLYKEGELKIIATRLFNSHSNFFEAALTKALLEKSSFLDGLIVDTIQAKGAELIPKLVDSKLPGFISRAVKDILKMARIRFYTEDTAQS